MLRLVPLLKPPNPMGINKGSFIIESLLPLEVIKKMEKTSLIGVT
jgi:hypothetical protein